MSRIVGFQRALLFFFLFLFVADRAAVARQYQGGLVIEKPPVITAPFDFDRDTLPYIIVRASINGKEPLYFIFDTGCEPPLVLFPWAAKQLKIRPTIPVEKAGPNDKIFRYATTKTVELITDKPTKRYPLPIVHALLAPNQMPEIQHGKIRVAGFMGVSLLEEFILNLDYVARRLTLTPYSEDPPPIAGIQGSYTYTAIEPNSPNKVFNIEVVPAGKVVMAALIDTGNPTSKFPANGFSGEEKLLRSNRNIASWDVFGDKEEGPLLLFPTITIGDMVEKDVPLMLSPNQEDCLLGNDFLCRFHVTIYYRHRRILLFRNPQYTENSALPGYTGMTLSRTPHGILISSLDSDSPAERAGLLPGDFIVSLDGKPFREEDIDLLEEGKADTALVVGVARPERNGKKTSLSITLKRASFFTAKPKIKSDGDSLQFNFVKGKDDKEGAFVIQKVDPGSWVEKAGIKPGDVVLAINGTELRNLPPAEIIALMRTLKDEIVLKIQTAGEKPREVRLPHGETP